MQLSHHACWASPQTLATLSTLSVSQVARPNPTHRIDRAGHIVEQCRALTNSISTGMTLRNNVVGELAESVTLPPLILELIDSLSRVVVVWPAEELLPCGILHVANDLIPDRGHSNHLRV